MAEGGDYDPTTEKTSRIPDTGDDDDDDNFDFSKYDIHGKPIGSETTQPFEPGGASTPAGGESIPMTTRTSFPKSADLALKKPLLLHPLTPFLLSVKLILSMKRKRKSNLKR